MWLHWSHMYRIVDEDRMGNLVYVWERSDRNDWALAMCYWRVGIERFSEQESSFEGGPAIDGDVPDAPFRRYDGVMEGKALKLTMPTLPEKDSDWRYN